MKLRGALDANRPYELPERHDPIYLMFDNDFLLGNLVPSCRFCSEKCPCPCRERDSLARVSDVQLGNR
jgi:hypothetical protein